MQQPLWQPGEERIRGTNINAFINAIEDDWNINVGDFDGLYEFSITEIDKFWVSLKNFGGVIAETWGNTVQENPGRMPGTRFFPDARLNFAENLLRSKKKAAAKELNRAANIFGDSINANTVIDKITKKFDLPQMRDKTSILSRDEEAMGQQYEARRRNRWGDWSQADK